MVLKGPHCIGTVDKRGCGAPREPHDMPGMRWLCAKCATGEMIKQGAIFSRPTPTGIDICTVSDDRDGQVTYRLHHSGRLIRVARSVFQERWSRVS